MYVDEHCNWGVSWVGGGGGVSKTRGSEYDGKWWNRLKVGVAEKIMSKIVIIAETFDRHTDLSRAFVLIRFLSLLSFSRNTVFKGQKSMLETTKIQIIYYI